MPPRSSNGGDAGPSQAAAKDGPAYRHAFLQACMQRGYLPEGEAKEIYRRICDTQSGVCSSLRGEEGEVCLSITLHKTLLCC